MFTRRARARPDCAAAARNAHGRRWLRVDLLDTLPELPVHSEKGICKNYMADLGESPDVDMPGFFKPSRQT
jgi:hypothetical protein